MPDGRERWVVEDPARQRADRDDFARDRARLVHSAALRRLCATTQVLRPGSDDFIRNRLTHSLEVAQIGREFGAALGCHPDVVDTACLAHDLGHPPFGHNGEEALDALAGDIGGFEGNAQTWRILTRLEAKRAHPDGRSAGLNLTRASLDAATKYPWRRQEAPAGSRKFGVYEQDLPVFTWMRTGAPQGRRCLEAQVMDWSDDVAYSVHDVEDAVAGGLLDLRILCSDADLGEVFAVARTWYLPSAVDADLESARARLVRCVPVGEVFDGTRNSLARLKDMTSGLIGRFVVAVERATRRAYGPGDLTRYAADLVVPDGVRAECALLKALAAHFVMLAPARVADRSQERQVIGDLVAAYAARPDERLDPPLRKDYAAAADDDARLRVVLDQVASLSDPRAVALHSRWCPETGR